MKYILLLLLSALSFISNAQFVSGVYDAQKIIMDSEELSYTIEDELNKVNWITSVENIYIMDEGKLDIPTIEMAFVLMDDSSSSDNSIIEESPFWVIMYMFDKSESERVKSFYKEISDPKESLVYFESAGTFCFLYKERNLNPNEERSFKELKEALMKFFIDHYDEM
ncbi:MAG: hypothetical protein QNK23_04985 [Crocinitomicaceae bacterium]|nr:hypothetical protein [Crocinitomicaceae bacterium]